MTGHHCNSHECSSCVFFMHRSYGAPSSGGRGSGRCTALGPAVYGAGVGVVLAGRWSGAEVTGRVPARPGRRSWRHGRLRVRRPGCRAGSGRPGTRCRSRRCAPGGQHLRIVHVVAFNRVLNRRQIVVSLLFSQAIRLRVAHPRWPGTRICPVSSPRDSVQPARPFYCGYAPGARSTPCRP